MSSVFVCYARQDSNFVERLTGDLIMARLSVWVDKWELMVGDSLIAKIGAAIKWNDYVVAVLSQSTVSSTWVQKELGAALMREFEEKHVIVLPVLVEDCDIPAFLSDKVYADFRRSYQSGLDQLLRVFRAAPVLSAGPVKREQAKQYVDSEEDVEAILRMSEFAAAERVIGPIETALAILKREAVTRYLVPTVPHIVMSLSTVQTIFEGFFRVLGKEKFDDVARMVGELVGESFGLQLMDFLAGIEGGLPKTNNWLLRIWTGFDTRAEWGQFRAEQRQSTIRVVIIDSFLTRGKTSDRHRYCGFMAGYVGGLLWVSLKERYRWFSDAILKPADIKPAEPPLEPVNVKESMSEENCTFTVDLQPEQLVSAFDLYWDARQAYRSQQYTAVGSSLRNCLDHAFKVKVGLDVTSRLSFEELLKKYKRVNIPNFPVNLTKTQKLWHKMSEITHADVPLTKPEAEELITEVGRILKQMELLSIGKDRRQKIREGESK